MWYLVRVKKVHPHLSYGFVNGQQVYMKRGFVDGQWIIYNGGYADRRLTTEECKQSVETVRRGGKPVVAPNQKRIETDWNFNLTR